MVKLHKFLVGAVVIGALGALSVGHAMADGARHRGSLKDVPDIVRYSWAGLYIGGHLGYGWADVDWSVVSETSAFWDDSGGAGTFFGQRADGLIGGGQVGFNFQTGPWVVGLELSHSAADLKDSRFAATITGDDLRTSKIGNLTLVTGRVGYAWDQWLAYIKGGYATANVRTSVSDVAPPSPGTWSASERHNGWTIGTGLEYMLARNVSVGVEYNYVDLGSERHAAATSDAGTAVADVDATMHAVWARLNLRLAP